MSFDILRGKMAQQRKSQNTIAHQIGMSPQSLCRKLSGKRQFTVLEAAKLCELLEIPKDERADIFLHQTS